MSNQSIDGKFVGQWRYFANIPSDNKPNDHTMDGLLNTLTKMENTNETYSFKLFTTQSLTLSKLDDTTLIDSEINARVIYHSTNEHLILMFNDSKGMEFSKLK
jgi:hypothetical protein